MDKRKRLEALNREIQDLFKKRYIERECVDQEYFDRVVEEQRRLKADMSRMDR